MRIPSPLQRATNYFVADYIIVICVRQTKAAEDKLSYSCSLIDTTYAVVGFGEAQPPRNPLLAAGAAAGCPLGVAAPAARKEYFGGLQALQTTRLAGDRVTRVIDTSYAVASLAFGRVLLFLLLYVVFRPAGRKTTYRKCTVPERSPQAMNHFQAVTA
jgi:hypothetical protein